MTLPNEKPLEKLQFYVTTGYACGYLPNKLAQSLIASPQHLITTQVYSGLIQQGFRRSGKFAYRPHCEHCRACIPVRVEAAQFKPSRSQKRAVKQHQDLTAEILPVAFYEEHFALYQAYQLARHQKTEPEENHFEVDEVDQYKNFLCESNIDSVMVEFRKNGVLKMVSLIDIVEDGISAVYTFFETRDLKASYGTFNVCWQIAWVEKLNLPYVYLGYWIQDSPKMAYKNNFQPLQKLVDGEWT